MAAVVALGGCDREPPEGDAGADGGGSALQDRGRFFLYCGLCGEDPAELEMFRSDFSDGFLGENESCRYAPRNLVDGDPGTGWAEGARGAGIGARVVVPKRLAPGGSARIWIGDGRSPEAFAAHGRPKRVRATVLRLRAAVPEAHDATGCSRDEYVEPTAVAERESVLRDMNGYQHLPLPEFAVERYEEYPLEWLLMDGTERQLHEERVEAGDAAPFRRVPTEYAYFLELTLLEAYAGGGHEHVVISEVGLENGSVSAGNGPDR